MAGYIGFMIQIQLKLVRDNYAEKQECHSIIDVLIIPEIPMKCLPEYFNDISHEQNILHRFYCLSFERITKKGENICRKWKRNRLIIVLIFEIVGRG